jgi:hypothetical protein
LTIKKKDMETKIVRRNVHLERKSKCYKCQYSDKRDFDKLSIEITFENNPWKTFEIESKYLPDAESIHFYVYPNGDSIRVEWNKNVSDYIREV